MSISIKENDTPKLKVCEMLCDTKLQTKFGLNLKELLAEFDEISIGHIATGKDKNGEEFLSIYYLVHI